MENNLVPLKTSSALARSEDSPLNVFQKAGRQIEYLRGKEWLPADTFKWALIGLAAFFVVKNLGRIENFFDTLATTLQQIIFCGVLGAIIWGLWLVLSSKKFRYLMAMLVDIGIEKVHKAMVARDKFGAAEFSIRRIAKRIRESADARANVYGTYQAVDQASKTAQRVAEDAFEHAKGFEEEIKRRQANEKPALKLSDDALLRAFNQAKSRLRINYEHFKHQSERAEMLRRRCVMLSEIGEVMQAKLDELTERLRLAREDFELALQSAEAMEGSNALVDSQEAKTYEEALDGIAQDTDMLNGRVLMIMERLDPSVQEHRMNQAAGQLDDTTLFEKFLEESKVEVKPDVKQKLMLPASHPELSDIEELLGNARKPEPVPVRAIAANRGASNFDDLLNRR